MIECSYFCYLSPSIETMDQADKKRRKLLQQYTSTKTHTLLIRDPGNNLTGHQLTTRYWHPANPSRSRRPNHRHPSSLVAEVSCCGIQVDLATNCAAAIRTWFPTLSINPDYCPFCYRRPIVQVSAGSNSG